MHKDRIMDLKESSHLTSSKEKIPFSKEDHRIMDREMATAEVMDGMIKKFASS